LVPVSVSVLVPDLDQRAARATGNPTVGDGSADFGAEIVQADSERLRAEVVGACDLD
jgi:hypothetical protein